MNFYPKCVRTCDIMNLYYYIIVLLTWKITGQLDRAQLQNWKPIQSNFPRTYPFYIDTLHKLETIKFLVLYNKEA